MADIRSDHGAAGVTENSREFITHMASAEASIMLIECIMLSLVETGVLTRQKLIESVENVIATKRQMISDGEHPRIAIVAAGLLSTLANSLAAADTEHKPRS